MQQPSSGSRAVAILLSEDARASELAQQLCMVVDCNLGMHVGLGSTGTDFISPASQVVFMTHRYFLGLQASPAMQMSWKAFIIVDVAHVPDPERDASLACLADIVKTQLDARVVVLKI